MILGLIYPQLSWAEGFTGAEFLTWSEVDQRGYISAQLVMASTIAARSQTDMPNCIASSFFDQSGMSASGFQSILATVAEYAEFHPSSVLVVVIENACGPFG